MYFKEKEALQRRKLFRTKEMISIVTECCGRGKKQPTKQLAEENIANSKHFSRKEVNQTQQARWHDCRQQQLGPQVQNITSQGRKALIITIK